MGLHTKTDLIFGGDSAKPAMIQFPLFTLPNSASSGLRGCPVGGQSQKTTISLIWVSLHRMRHLKKKALQQANIAPPTVQRALEGLLRGALGVEKLQGAFWCNDSQRGRMDCSEPL